MFLCFLTCFAGTQNPTTLIDLGDDDIAINIIPSALTKDGKAELYLREFGNKGDNISILDENLKVKQQFTIKESLLDQYDLIENIRIISGELGPVDYNPDALGSSEDGFILFKDIFGNGYNFLMAADDGIKVFNSECNEIAQLNIPNGYELTEDWDSFAFLRLGNSIYFKAGLHKDGDQYYDQNFIALYKIDDNGNGVSLVAIAPAAKVSPRAPRKGENVTVTISSEMSGRDCMLQVTSTSGQTIFDTKIPTGQTQIDINTSSFPKGVYVVSVVDNGDIRETAKIIIR